ncbi:MAG: DUF3570 domain-containing protein [Tenuifilaceae bacterium]|nr:DUF3570 domain-containing protein [Tenuifilaceae bacterium]
MKNYIVSTFILSLTILSTVYGQEDSLAYKKKVLESAEVDFLMSLYTQDGNNAAVTGGVGSEKLLNGTPTIVVAVPLTADDVLTVDAGISAYSSASSSNINPFDGKGSPNVYQASSGASKSDVLSSVKVGFSHSSDNRNRILGVNASFSSEFDYFSFGVGASYSMLFNEKNTELSFKANAFFDKWSRIYPVELRDNPSFIPLSNDNRNSYSAGVVLTQVLGENLQGALAADVVYQEGLLSTPFQRVYFSDIPDVFLQGFHLAEDIERLPGSRVKVAVGGRLHYYVNQYLVFRSFYRYYSDDWGIQSSTATVELPVKLTDKFTLYPYYRFYNQSATEYFAPYNQHVSSAQFYTSDYDLSNFVANQYGMGFSYTDIFAKHTFLALGLKSIDFKYSYYQRSSGLQAHIITFGVKFIVDPYWRPWK